MFVRQTILTLNHIYFPTEMCEKHARFLKMRQFQLSRLQFCSCVVYHAATQSTMGTSILFHVSLFYCILWTTFAQKQLCFRLKPVFALMVCRTRAQDEHQWRGSEKHWSFGQRGWARWAGSLHVQPHAYLEVTQLQPKCGLLYKVSCLCQSMQGKLFIDDGWYPTRRFS